MFAKHFVLELNKRCCLRAMGSAEILHFFWHLTIQMLLTPRQQSKNRHMTNLQTRKWWEQAEWRIIKFLSSHVKWSCCLLKARIQVPASGRFSVCLALHFAFPCFPALKFTSYFFHPLWALTWASQKSDQSALIIIFGWVFLDHNIETQAFVASDNV